MNKDRREALDKIITKLEEAFAAVGDMAGDEGFLTQMQKAKNAVDGLPIEDTKEEEREAFDALPEGLQAAEKGQIMEEAIDYMEQAESHVTEATDKLEFLEGLFEEIGQEIQEAIDSLQNAKGLA